MFVFKVSLVQVERVETCQCFDNVNIDHTKYMFRGLEQINHCVVIASVVAAKRAPSESCCTFRQAVLHGACGVQVPGGPGMGT